MEITIPIINIQMSLSTLIAIILLLILFFTFFSVQIFLGGSLSPEAIAKDVTPCDADPSAFSQVSEDVIGDISSGIADAAISLERDFVSGVESVLSGAAYESGSNATGSGLDI